MMNAIRLKKRFVALAVLISLVLAMSFEICLVKAPVAWWDTDWHYRMPVTITSTQVLTDYPVLVTVDTQSLISLGKMNPDGSDIRFVEALGPELSYWIETPTINTPTTRIWVNIPSIPIGDTTIWMYYGNPAASPASNGDATFEFFDDDWDLPSEWGNPIFTREGGGAWESDYVSYPNIFKEGDTYYQLYDGHHPHQKGLATSSDLITWTRDPSNPVVIASGIPGAWDQSGVAWGDTVKVGSTYYMLVAGQSDRWTIGVETSTDLISWNRSPPGATNPVLVASEPWEGGSGGSLSGTAVLKALDGITPVLHDGRYWMAYHDYSYYQIGLAYSDDLLTWTKYGGNPILSPTEPWESQGLWVCSLVEHEGTYYIFYYGRSGLFHMGYAWSDATTEFPGTWHKTTDYILEYGPPGSWDDTDHEDPFIRKFDDTYYLFYTGRGAVYANGFATAPSITGPFTKYGGMTSGRWLMGGSPTVTDGIIGFGTGDWIESPDTYSPGHAMGYRANFKGSANIYKWTGFISGHMPPFTYIGVVEDVAGGNLVLTNYITGPRQHADLGAVTDAFNVYEVAWLSDETRAYIDHSPTPAGSLTGEVPTDPLPIGFQNYADNVYTIEADWVYLRPFSDPEPTAALGAEEELPQAYYLTVVSPYGTPGGEGWYDMGDTAYATLDVGLVEESGVIYGFTGWTGDASGWYLVSEPILMDGPKTAIAAWETSETYGDVLRWWQWKAEIRYWYFTERGEFLGPPPWWMIPEEELINHLVYIDENSECFSGVVVYNGDGAINRLETLENAYEVYISGDWARAGLFTVWLNLAHRAFFWNSQLSQEPTYLYKLYNFKDDPGLTTIGEAIQFCEAELPKPDGDASAVKSICTHICAEKGIIWGT